MKKDQPGIRLRPAALILAATCLAMPLAMAQDFPTRPIRLVVPYAAGGVTDATARAIAVEMGKELGQSIIVDNKAGAGGILGTDYVAKSPPDGYTICFCASGVFVILPHLDSKLPLKPATDLLPVTHVYDAELLLVVREDFPAPTFERLITLARAKPGGLSYGSVGIGSANQLGMEALRKRSGADFVHIPYKGEAPQIADLLGGQLDIALLSTQGGLNLAKGGKVRLLASTGPMRAPGAPDVPTIAESGYPGFLINTWIGMFVPAKTPKAVVDRIHTAATSVINTPAMRDRMESQGLRPNGESGAKLGSFVAAESVRWGKVIRDLNLKIE